MEIWKICSSSINQQTLLLLAAPLPAAADEEAEATPEQKLVSSWIRSHNLSLRSSLWSPASTTSLRKRTLHIQCGESTGASVLYFSLNIHVKCTDLSGVFFLCLHQTRREPASIRFNGSGKSAQHKQTALVRNGAISMPTMPNRTPIANDVGSSAIVGGLGTGATADPGASDEAGGGTSSSPLESSNASKPPAGSPDEPSTSSSAATGRSLLALFFLRHV